MHAAPAQDATLCMQPPGLPTRCTMPPECLTMHAAPRGDHRMYCCPPEIPQYIQHFPGWPQPLKASGPSPHCCRVLVHMDGREGGILGRKQKSRWAASSILQHPDTAELHTCPGSTGDIPPPGSRERRQPPLGSYPWGQPGKGRRASAATGEYSGEQRSPLPAGRALMLGKRQAREGMRQREQRVSMAQVLLPSPTPSQRPGVSLPITPHSPELSAKIHQHS